MQKVTLTMRVAVHPIKADLWKQRHKITPDMSLRQIGKLVGVTSSQKIKHHLQAKRSRRHARTTYRTE